LLKNGVIKVMDFGIAKRPNAETVTVTDKAIGTVYYISPEQVTGGEIDGRSDIYSLGVMMYEMATGQLPFTGDTPVSIALMQVNEEPTAPREINPHIPQGLEQIILKAMEKDPAERYQSAEEMLGQLVKLRENPKIIFKDNKQQKKTTKSAPVKTVTKKSSRAMFPIIMGVTLAFLITAGIAAYYLVNKIFFNSSMNNYRMLTVDEFVGHIYDERLEDWLKKNGDSYDYKVVYQYNDKAAENVIIEQEPEPGEVRKILPGKQKCELTLTVSQGEKTIVLADYSVRDYRLVEAELRKLGLRVRTENVENSVFEVGYVIGTSPEVGSVLKENQIVTVYVSHGSEETKTVVPDFIGHSEAEAYILAKQNRVTVSRVIYAQSWSAPVGTVMKQSVEPWQSVAEFDGLELTISGGSYYTGDGTRIPEKSDYTWSNDKLLLSNDEEEKEDKTDEPAGGTDTASAGNAGTSTDSGSSWDNWNGGGTTWDGGVSDWNAGTGTTDQPVTTDPEPVSGGDTAWTDTGNSSGTGDTSGSGDSGAGGYTWSGGTVDDGSGGDSDWYDSGSGNSGGWIFVGDDFYGSGYQP
ncbi:MAG: PASTA domain-containing protein, partial [Clostridia bacterium]|nr:PASTA domain-containing protein [Clostridia bacterium]